MNKMIGRNGEVKCPPRGHKDKHFVGKLIPTTKEFENIQMISEYPEYDFMSSSSIEVFRYQLIMPKIEGQELSSFLDTFVNEENRINTHDENYQKELPLMDLETFDNLIRSLIELYHFVVKLNEDGLYHNDISTVNVIYNKDTNKLTLIDFEHLSRTKQMFQKDPDMSGLGSILSEILKCAVYSPELKLIVEEYDLLKPGKFVRLKVNIHQFVEIYN